MVGRFNLGKGNSKGGGLFPIYQQMTEPTKKEGVWIKTNDKLKDIYFANNNECVTNEWVQLEGLTYPAGYYGYGVYLNSKIYYGTAYKQLIEYDPISKISTLIKTFDYEIKSVVLVNKIIYVFTYDSNYLYIYKQETNNTFSLVCTDYKYNYFPEECASNGTDIYFTRRSNNDSSSYLYRFDTISNTVIQAEGTSLLPIKNPAVVSFDNDIYLFELYLYKYSTITKSLTQIRNVNIRYSYNTKFINVKETVYYFNSNLSACKKYNLLTDTLTSICDLPRLEYYSFIPVVVDDDIYCFGGNSSLYSLYKFKTKFNANDGIYIFLNLSKNEDVGGYLPNELYKFIRKIKLMKNNEKLNNETYIGDGTSWNLLN